MPCSAVVYSGLTFMQHIVNIQRAIHTTSHDVHLSEDLEEEEEVVFFPGITCKVAFSMERMGQISTGKAFCCTDVSWAVRGGAGLTLLPAVRNEEARFFSFFW